MHFNGELDEGAFGPRWASSTHRRRRAHHLVTRLALRTCCTSIRDLLKLRFMIAIAQGEGFIAN